MNRNRLNPSEYKSTIGLEHLSDDESGEFVELVDNLMQRMSEGETIDLEALCKQQTNPEFCDRLRQIFPVIHAVSNLSVDGSANSADRSDNPAPPPQFVNDNGRLGDFRLIREIGRGGMGVVYEAEQVSLNRRVAIKVLPFAGLLDERQLQRFKNEARAAAMLRHPHIVNVFHVGCDRGIHFYAMDFVDGQSLAEIRNEQFDDGQKRTQVTTPSDAKTAETTPIAHLSTRRTSQREEYFRGVAKLGIQAAEALQEAHQQGVIHRDIKPSNLLIDKDGMLHVTDFGLAHVSSGAEITMTGDLVGTLRYMSPEQAEGHRAVDHRTDICSLGLTLYELATGQPAFTASKRGELLQQVIETEPPAPSKHCPHIPRDFETVILKAIEKDPSARYDSAEELAHDLSCFVQRRPVTARRIGKSERARRWIQRNPTVAGLMGAVGAMLLLVAIGSSALAMRLTAQAHRREIAIYAADIRMAQQALNDGRRFDAETLLMKWAPDKVAHDHRGFEWYHLWLSCHDPALEHTIRHQLPVESVSFMSESSRVAIAGWDRMIRIRDTNDEFQLWRELDSDSYDFKRKVQFLHRSKTLLSVEWNGTAVEWDPINNKALPSFEVPMYPSESFQFMCDESPEGRYLAVGGGNDVAGTLVIIDRSTGQRVFEDMELPGMPFPTFAASGELVILFRGSGQISVVDTVAWRLIPRVELPQVTVRAIAVSPDRRRMAVSTYHQRGVQRETNIQIVDLANYQVVDQISTDGLEIRCLDFSHDGQLLAAGTNDSNWMVVFRQQEDEFCTVAQIQAHDGTITDVEFSPDAKYLVSSGYDGHVNFWSLPRLLDRNVEGSIKLPVTRIADSNPANPVSSASRLVPRQQLPTVKLRRELKFTLQGGFIDDHTICNGSGNGELVFWDAQTGEVTDTVQLDSSDFNVVSVAISDDRKSAGVVMGYSPVKPGPGKLVVIDLETKHVVYSVELPRGISSGEQFAFSRDNRYFVTLMRGWMTVLDLTREEELREFKFHGNLKRIEFAPDGQTAVVTSTNGKIYQLEVPSFETKREESADQLAIGSHYSPDGSRLAVVGFDKRVHLFDARTLAPIHVEFSKTSRYLVDVEYSPDGQRILTSSPDGNIQLWHAESGERLLTFEVRDGWYPRVAFSPHGNTLAYFGGPDAYAIHSADPNKLMNLSSDELTEIACQHIEDH